MQFRRPVYPGPYSSSLAALICAGRRDGVKRMIAAVTPKRQPPARFVLMIDSQV